MKCKRPQRNVTVAQDQNNDVMQRKNGCSKNLQPREHGRSAGAGNHC